MSDGIVYVKVPKNHIVIDFDIPDENGNKTSCVHLNYIRNNDIKRLAEEFTREIYSLSNGKEA